MRRRSTTPGVTQGVTSVTAVDLASSPALVTSTACPTRGGDWLLGSRPSSFQEPHPRADISGGEIRFSYHTASHDEEEIRRELDWQVGYARRHADRVNDQVGEFNDTLPSLAQRLVAERRDKFLADRQTAAALGVPLKRRADAPETYTSPVARRRLLPTMPPMEKARFQPEAVLDMPEYEHILRIVLNMARVMELSPGAFKTLDEEDLRTHFLVQLNAQYEGLATGETFNFEGKTDILVRWEGRNVFIAECKFWDGPAKLTATIDQMLSYTSWRDTKTAILLFSKNKDLTSVLERIPPTVEKHANFKRRIAYESGFRCLLHHRDDPARELLLTVLAFEVPG